MSDENVGFSLQGSGQVADSNQSDPEVKDTPETITKADLDAYFSRFEKRLSEVSQSISDRTQDRVKKALDEKMQKLDDFFRDRGLSQEEQAAIRQQVRAETLKEEALRSVSQEPEPVKRQKEEVSAVNRRVGTYLSDMGVTFQDGDPEISMIVTTGTADQYERSVMKAASAWLKRVSSEKPNPEARIPGLVGGQGKAKEDWQAEYRKEIAAAQKDPINGVEKSLQVRRKYRQLGYSV